MYKNSPTPATAQTVRISVFFIIFAATNNLNTMLRHLLCIMITTVLLGAFAACDDDNETRYVFIGDSIVECWDLKESFPTLMTRNLGIGGTGIEYLQQQAGTLTGSTAVIVSGTNNIWRLTDEGSAAPYAEEYVAAVKALGADHNYVVSILPRNLDSDPPEFHDAILKVNAAIRERCASEPSITYINVYPLLTKEDSDEANPRYFYDGVHPSTVGYEIITGEVNRYIL